MCSTTTPCVAHFTRRGAYRNHVTIPPCAHTSTEISPPTEVPSGYFSNQSRQQVFRIEILDSKRRVLPTFTRPPAWGRDRSEMRRCPAEVGLRRRRSTKTLVRAEVGVVQEAQLDLLHQVFRYGWPQ